MENSNVSVASPSVAVIDVVPIRCVWPKEALHFTKWLEDNIEALNARLGLQLTVLEREKKVGDFIVDLWCQDATGRSAIVENQLERTDHDHLGKVLTYLVNLDAKLAIWVAPELRPEHHKVVDWLNEATPADLSFYLVKVEAIRIGTSPFAPLFTIAAGPDRQAKDIGIAKKDVAGKQNDYREFWTGLLERSKGKTPLFGSISPSTANWIQATAGKAGFTYIYQIAKESALVDLNIEFGSNFAEKNKQVFDLLAQDKEAIEQEYGATLLWDRMEGRQSARIRRVLSKDLFANPDTWPQLQDELIDALIRLDKVFQPRIKNLSL